MFSFIFLFKISLKQRGNFNINLFGVRIRLNGA